MLRRLARTGVLAACALAGGTLVGCDDEPDAPLDEAVLIDLLTDLHLADARADALAPPDVADSLRLAYRDEVFRRYDLDEAGWNELLDGLAKHPERLAASYDSVLARLANEPGDLPHRPSGALAPQGPIKPFPPPSD